MLLLLLTHTVRMSNTFLSNSQKTGGMEVALGLSRGKTQITAAAVTEINCQDAWQSQTG